MNQSPRRSAPESSNRIDQEQAFAGEVSPTTSRFSLVRPGWAGVVDDIIGSKSYKEYKRFLVCNDEFADISTYQKLQEAEVPQLPLLDTHSGSNGIAIFGVRTGLKLLSWEAVHSRESSGTYIGDTEIFETAGKLYKQAWKATGTIFLDSNNLSDSPLDHIAISKFSDQSGYLFLCPPYSVSKEFTNLSEEQAQELFMGSLAHRMTQYSDGYYSEMESIKLRQLIAAAENGFQEA